jgi:ATP-binding cassette subfamily B protein
VLVLFGGKLIGKRFKRVQEGFSRLSEHVQESLSGIRVIKTFVREPWTERRFAEHNEEYLGRNMKLVRIWGLFFPVITFVSGLSLLFLLYFGGRSVVLGEFTTGDFVAFMSYLTMLRWPVIGMGFTVNMLQRGAASLTRINAIMNEPPEITSPPEPAEAEPRGQLRIDGLTFRYEDGGEPVLREISVRLPRGRTLGILGRTGSGKSTLVRLIPRLLDPPPGTVSIGGRDVREYRLDRLRGGVGFVPQDTFLFSATIKENLAFGRPEAAEEEIARASRLSTIDRELGTFPQGWDTPVGERGLTLSGGQKQRVAISRAVLTDPEILVFDDALASVDAETEERILDGFLRERQEKTNILVAHRVSTLMYADHIIVLDEGRIVQEGSHEELLAQEGLYRDIYRLQQYTGGGL